MPIMIIPNEDKDRTLLELYPNAVQVIVQSVETLSAMTMSDIDRMTFFGCADQILLWNLLTQITNAKLLACDETGNFTLTEAGSKYLSTIR